MPSNAADVSVAIVVAVVAVVAVVVVVADVAVCVVSVGLTSISPRGNPCYSRFTLAPALRENGSLV